MEEKITVEELKAVGLDRAASELEAQQEFFRKTAIAYENFRYVTPEKINQFNEGLRKKTEKVEGKNRWGDITVYDRLVFTRLSDYKNSPPKNVLNSILQAKEKKCFDDFEIAKIESHREVPDPIVFGRIKGCPDYFFIDQWDNDVKISDILKENEG